MTNLKKGIRPLFRDHVFAGRSLLLLEEAESTNLLCLNNRELLSRGGLVLCSRKQSRGIGRNNRRWEQGGANHLFSSFVIHLDAGFVYVPVITLLAGLSVYRALDIIGTKDLSIKWPNDILIKGKKVSGILCQSKPIGKKLAVVAGIGVNIAGSSRQFTKGLRSKATTLNEQGILVEPIDLLKGITLEFEKILVKAHKGETSALLQDWKNCALCIGENICFEDKGVYRKGVIRGIDKMGRLIVSDESGRLSMVESGEIEYDYQ